MRSRAGSLRLPLGRSFPCTLAFAAVALVLTAHAASAQFPPAIRGRVVAVGGAGVIAGAVIEVSGGGPRVVSGGDGTFVLRGLLPGRREVWASAFGYRERRVEVALENGGIETITIELFPDPVTVPGVVARAGEPIEFGAAVMLRGAIESSGARDLSELLETQPGLIVTRRGGPGSPATLSIRGSSADEVLVLLDGTPLNSPITGEADFSAVPLEAVERVTVLRGARSARYGPRALAGVVLIETRRPSAGELTARAGAGAWGEHWAALTAGNRFSMRRLEVSGLVAAEWRGVRGDFPYAVPRVRGGGVATRQNADAEILSVLAQTAVESGSGTVLRSRLEALRVERGMPGSIVQSALTGRQAQDRQSFGIGGSGIWHALDWRIDVDAQGQDARFQDPSPPFGPKYDERVKVRGLGGTLSAGLELARAELTVGLEARGLEVSSSMLAAGTPKGQRLAGVWAQGQVSTPLAHGWTLALQPALRGDHSSLLHGLVLSPRIGASVSRSRLSARVSLGNAFSPPSLSDQFFQEGLLARPNPDLRPERVRREVEVAAEIRDVSAGPAQLDLELAAHRSDVDGMILWFPDHRFVWQPDNFDIHRRGWEASTRARFPWREAELRGSFSHAATEYAGNSLAGQVRYRPRGIGNAAAAARAFGVRIELSTRYVGARRTVAGSALNSLPAYWLTDLRLSRPAGWRGWRGEVTAELDNLLDRDAAMLVDYPFPGRTWTLGVRVRRDPRRRSLSGDTVSPDSQRTP